MSNLFTNPAFKTKKDFEKAIKDGGQKVLVYGPGLGQIRTGVHEVNVGKSKVKVRTENGAVIKEVVK